VIRRDGWRAGPRRQATRGVGFVIGPCDAQLGQAAVELVALLPLLLALALGVLQALAAGAASELADHAAQSAAVALAEGRDGAAAARAAVPGWSRTRIEVEIRGTRVRVRLIPPSPVPGLGERLASSASADAGPAR
jgi:hypothetical protein